MVPPLQNTFGPLPTDSPISSQNASFEPLPDTQSSPSSPQPSLSPSLPPSLSSASSSSSSSSKPRMMSYAAATASSRTRNETVIYRSSTLSGQYNDTIHPVVHKTGTTDFSVFYHVPKKLAHLRSEVALRLSEKFPFGVGLGLTSTEDPLGTVIEISLVSQEACDNAVSQPVVVDEKKFHASPAIHPDRALLEVNLTKLPIWEGQRLRDSLLNNLSRYGVVREMTLYLDNWSGCWFTGNGHVYLERPNTNNKAYETLSYKIPLEGDNTFCLGTWTNMGKHCVYCKETGHYRKECTKAPTEKRRCYQCGNTGHIARNCFRTDTVDNTSNKRRRNERIEPKHRIMKTSQPVAEVAVQKGTNVTSPVVTSPETSAIVLEDVPPAESDTVIPSVPVRNLEPNSSPNVTCSTRNTSRRPAHLEDFVVPSSQEKTCKCGSASHRKTDYSQCPLNKKNLKDRSAMEISENEDQVAKNGLEQPSLPH
ncbi:hypothetical protein A0J61_10149 [Choanephora cucurbitarum]|uniref:CCHC-type domain-containing protein n=1 Tax=Choanephora cucurbitarum TaxID=101091 RepID=A0A1C7MYD8_9FUNG|nr:hypothetical protein A0J61_10149 [Choanephora cucurbitarum]